MISTSPSQLKSINTNHSTKVVTPPVKASPIFSGLSTQFEEDQQDSFSFFLDFTDSFPQNFNPSRVLLFKKVPYNIDELEIISLCHPFGIITDIYIIPSREYVFLQFKVIIYLWIEKFNL